jgi:hypothetical protein
MVCRWTIVIFLMIGVYPLSAQKINPDSIPYLLKQDKELTELDSLLNSGDRSDLLSLIDSLVNMPEISLPSQLVLRVGYNSNLTSQSRTLGFDQFGLIYGASYYHSSGFYVDGSAYWSQEFEPKHYLTIASGGYIYPWSKRLMSVIEYSHLFYSYRGQEADVPFSNNIQVSNFADFKYISLRLDYSFLFGNESGHRIIPGVLFNLKIEKVMGLERITFNPGYTAVFGNDRYTEQIPYTTNPLEVIFRIRRQLPLYYDSTTQGFGVMSHNFVFPLSIHWKKWNLLCSYSFILPRKVAEPIDTDPSGFFSFGLSKTINLK